MQARLLRRGDDVTALHALVGFGATGGLGPLHLGARLREVAGTHGPPQDLGRVHERRRWPHRYAYGDVEVVVCRCRTVVAVTVRTWRGTVELPSDAPGRLDALPSRLTLAQVTDALAAAGCRWEPLRPVPGQRGLRTLPAGVDFVFVDAGPDPLLDTAGTWLPAHECITADAAAAAFPDDFPPESPRPP